MPNTHIKRDKGAGADGKAKRLRFLIYLAVIVLVFLADMGSKSLAQTHLQYGQPVAVLPHLNWFLVYNKGAAFSLFNSGGWQLAALIGVTLLLSVYLLWRLWKVMGSSVWQALGLSLIVGGAVGNVVNRIVLGHVIDFIDVYVGRYHWPTFNVADSAICVGVFLLIVTMLRGRV